MTFIVEVKTLLKKEFLQEWRSKYFLSSVLLNILSTVFVCYLSFKALDSNIWITLFWIIMLFISTGAIVGSFSNEGKPRQIYYYTVVSPEAVIVSKIIYNIMLMLLLSFFTLLFYVLVFKFPIHHVLLYIFSVFLGSISLASSFTMVSAIASQANKNAALMSILGFPIMIPLLMLLIRLSKAAVLTLTRNTINADITVLLCINLIVLVVSLLLFPYLWRD
jgi:heme exporter protein B